MAAISIDSYSSQQAGFRASERSYIPRDELGGRVKIAYFSYTADGAVAANQVLGLTALRRGWRILGGKVYSSGAVATADLDVGLAAQDGSGVIDAAGTADDADLLGDAIDIATAGVYDLHDTEPSALGYKLEKDCYLIGTLLNAGLADGDVLKGYILYTEE